MQELQTDVLIIGGGPTGMVTALGLSRLGVRCVVLERHIGPASHPKAHELSGRSIEILGGLGVPYEELAREASPDADASRILFCDTIAREFGCIDVKALPDVGKYARHLPSPTGYLNLSQVELEKVLARHVAGEATVEVRRGCQWDALEQDADGVVSVVSDLTHGETLRVRSRFVVAADGAGSRCRAALGVTMVGPDKLRDFVSASFEADLGEHVATRGKLYFIFSPEAPGVFIAHDVAKRWVFHSVVATPHERVEDVTPELMRARILAALGRPDLDIVVQSISPWRMTAQIADKFRVGRVLLAGDAAHRFPPTGGLGMNSGIADAHNLAWKLAAVLSGRAPPSLLDSYELERRPVVRTLCDESRHNFERMNEILDAFGIDPDALDAVAMRMATGPIAALPPLLRGWIRRQIHRHGSRALARFHRRPEVARRVLAAIARQVPHFDRIGLDLGLAYARGALLADGTPPDPNDDPVRTYVPSTRPGARFPHFWLDGNLRTRSSLRWVDYRHYTLLLGADCEIAPADRAALELACAQSGVRVRSAGEGDIPPSCRGSVHRYAQIEADGAVMIRPDGHVSWRQRSGVRPSAALLESIVQQTVHNIAGV